MEEILVDEFGYKQFFSELKRLEELSNLNSVLGSEVYKDAVGDGWHDNFAFEESMRESRLLAKKIDDMLKKQKYLKIVEDKKKEDDLVNLGDTVSVNIKYDKDDIENEIITLTGNFIPNNINCANEISLNSPLGKVLFKAKIGTSKSYLVGNSEVFVTILEKVKK